jgi:hypothetical protein
MEEFLGSLACDGSFLRKHHRDVISNGIDELAGVAFQTGIIREQVHGFLANRADEDGEKLLGDRHGSLQGSKETVADRGYSRPVFHSLEFGGRPLKAIFEGDKCLVEGGMPAMDGLAHVILGFG